MQKENCLNILQITKESIFAKIPKPTFDKVNQIWNKNSTSCKQNPGNDYILNNQVKYKFFKLGKTLGFQVCRYLRYFNGSLYYYENKDDFYYRGFCQLQNLYMRQFRFEYGLVLQLSNGHISTVVQFPTIQFWKNFQTQIKKQVIQLNFKQKYVISEQIGEGTFSKVYAVTNKISNQKFAAKIVRKTDENGLNNKSIVDEQKRILTKLNSSYICKMYEFFEDDISYIFILQFFNGKDLNVLLKQHSIDLTTEHRIMIIKQTLRALCYIHKHNIIHRDIKPHNIIVNLKRKSVKLIDFGLSLMFDKNTQLNKYIKCGTIGYIAPQVLNNDKICRKKYDCKSDMFGFGIVAHMVLIGNNPLKCKTYNECVIKNMKGQMNIDKKFILESYGISCVQFFQSLFNKDTNLRTTALEILQFPFFKEKHKDDINITIEIKEDEISRKSGDQNYIEEIKYVPQSLIIKDVLKPHDSNKKRKTQKLTGMF